MKQRTDKSDINEEYNISIFRNGGLPRLPELVKHDDSDTTQRSYQVRALGCVIRQVSRILTSLEAFILFKCL